MIPRKGAPRRERMTLPEPLTPADLDLRDFTYMPLEVLRLRDSDIVVLATGDEFRAAVMLWCASWHQVPAASIPMDERLLANLAGYGRDVEGWQVVRDAALRGFVECSDGRLYHPVIAEKAIEAGNKRRNQRVQTAAATEARLKKLQASGKPDSSDMADCGGERDEPRNETRHDAVEPQRNVHQGKGRERRGREGKGIEKRERDPPPNVSGGSASAPEPPATPMTLEFTLSDADIAASRGLGMDDAAINGELGKFIALNMRDKVKRGDWSASWVLWCHRWKERANAGSPTKARATPADQHSPSDQTWEAAAKLFAMSASKWSSQLGPEPGMIGCRCPPEILRKNGIDPATGLKLRESA
jgi:hypothetical protein